MPIRPENKARYPKNWKDIRTRILKRAENDIGIPCCEQCGAPDGVWIVRYEDGWEATDQLNGDGTPHGVRIVLTIAHLDHTPENCADDNLRAWCQRCHNRYDAPMRRQGIKQRLHATKALGDFIEALRKSPTPL